MTYQPGRAVAEHAERVRRLAIEVREAEDAMLERLDDLERQEAAARRQITADAVAHEKEMAARLARAKRANRAAAKKLEAERAKISALRKKVARREEHLARRLEEVETAIRRAEQVALVADVPSQYGGRAGLEAATREMFPRRNGLNARQNTP